MRSGPTGLRGWLILPLLGFIGTAAFTGVNIFRAAQESSGLLLILRNESGGYGTLRILLILSIVFGLFVFVSACWCTFLLLSRRKAVIGLTVYHYSALVLASVFDYWSDVELHRVFPSEAADPNGLRDLARGIMIACIWIPYFQVSKRVRNSLVRP